MTDDDHPWSRRRALAAAATGACGALAGCSTPLGSGSVPERPRGLRSVPSDVPGGNADRPERVRIRATGAVAARQRESEVRLPYGSDVAFGHTAARVGVDRERVAYDVAVDVGGGRVVGWRVDHDREAVGETLLDGTYVDDGTHQGFDLFVRPAGKRAPWSEYWERLSDGVATDGSVLAFAGGPDVESPLEPLRGVLDARAGAVDRYFEADPLGNRLRETVAGDATVTAIRPRPPREAVEEEPDLTPGVAGVTRELRYEAAAVAERVTYLYDDPGDTDAEAVASAYRDGVVDDGPPPDVRSVRAEGRTVVATLRTPIERFPRR